MVVILSLTEVQIAVADYLRKKGLIVDDAEQVQLMNFSQNFGGFTSIVGVTPTVVVNGVKLPEGGPCR